MSNNPMQARCAAHCRTTGNPCLNFPMLNGRCRMHGGKSPGRPVKHGFYTQQALAERKQLNKLLCDMQGAIREFVAGYPYSIVSNTIPVCAPTTNPPTTKPCSKSISASSCPANGPGTMCGRVT